jgi:hypothetical protein
LVVTTSNAGNSGVTHSGFALARGGDRAIRLDAAFVDSTTLAIAWIVDQHAWSRTIRLDSMIVGPLRDVTDNAQTLRIVPGSRRYSVIVLREGRICVWEGPGRNPAPVDTDPDFVKSFDAARVGKDLVCVSKEMCFACGRNIDELVVTTPGLLGEPALLERLRFVPGPLDTPPTISVEHGVPVVRAIVERLDSTALDVNRPSDIISTSSTAGESSRLYGPISRETRPLFERFKKQKEKFVLEYRGKRYGTGWKWMRSPLRRFDDPGPYRILAEPVEVVAVPQRHFSMLIDRGLCLEWVRWHGHARVPDHVRVSRSGSANGIGFPKLGGTVYPDSTALLAWIGVGNRTSQVRVAIASPEGNIRRISMAAFPSMENASSIRVLRSRGKTIFVLARSSYESAEPRVGIEAWSIPDELLRAQPEVPFD